MLVVRALAHRPERARQIVGGLALFRLTILPIGLVAAYAALTQLFPGHALAIVLAAGWLAVQQSTELTRAVCVWGGRAGMSGLHTAVENTGLGRRHDRPSAGPRAARGRLRRGPGGPALFAGGRLRPCPDPARLVSDEALPGGCPTAPSRQPGLRRIRHPRPALFAGGHDPDRRTAGGRSRSRRARTSPRCGCWPASSTCPTR